MKFSDNQIRSVYPYFQLQLNHLYPEREIRNLADMALENFFGHSKTFIAVNDDLKLSESEMLRLIHLVKELKTGRPIQYALGTAHFMGMDLFVNDKCLIPRPETEELVHWINTDRKAKSYLRILDVGCGSGCISLALKKTHKFDSIYAMDLSKEALEITKKNSLNLSLDIEVVHDDALNPRSILQLGKFDIIVSNPPYVLESEASSMHKNVVEFEPHLALFVSNNDALVFYKAIAALAKKSLKTRGLLYFEINEQYGESLIKLLSMEGFTDITLKKDLNNKDRMLRAELL